MSVGSVLAAGRRAAESRMTSRCTVKRQSPTETALVDGYEVPVWVVVYADLPVRVGGSERGGRGSRTVRLGDVEVQVATRVAHFPADTAGLVDGDIVEVTSGEFVGFLRIVEAAWADQQTARRVPVVETQQPDGWS